LTVLNPSPWQQPPMSFYGTAHTLIVNETECCALFGFELGLVSQTSDDLPLHQIFHQHIKTCLSDFFLQWHAAQRLIITLGAGGVLVFERGGLQAHMPAHTVTAVDTLGAGDAFASAFCRAFVKYRQNDTLENFEIMRLEYALQQGQLSGAHLVQTVGVIGALPNEKQLDKLARVLPSLPLTLLS
jgi:ribokinase